jgi:uncharacterized membrane protein
MEMISKITLFLHIASGFTALLAGASAILTQKGGKNHLLSGKIYYWAMTGVAFSAVVLAIFKGITFLFLIAIFSYYMNFTGRRTLQLKQIGSGQQAEKIDWFVLAIASLSGVVMVSFAFLGYVPLPQAVGLFGLIMCFFALNDLWFLQGRNKDKKTWLYRHIGRMCGAYIATFTAFLVVNVHTNPAFIAWIAPTVIGTPVIAYYIVSYKKKFRKTA